MPALVNMKQSDFYGADSSCLVIKSKKKRFYLAEAKVPPDRIKVGIALAFLHCRTGGATSPGGGGVGLSHIGIGVILTSHCSSCASQRLLACSCHGPHGLSAQGQVNPVFIGQPGSSGGSSLGAVIVKAVTVIGRRVSGQRIMVGSVGQESG